MSALAEIRSHTVVSHHDGSVQVQHFGPSHVVEGSEQIIVVPIGTTVVVRHVAVLDEPEKEA